MTATPARHLATADDLLAMDPDGAYEIYGGEIVEKAAPSGEHGRSQARLISGVAPSFDRRVGGPGGPGGWWILLETEVELASHDVIRPDIAGWRRDRVPECPTGFPVRERPDWVCEILSPATQKRDMGPKRDLLFAAGVPHYWLVDTAAQVLTVLRRTSEGYLVAQVAGPGDTVGLEPFAAVPLDVGLIFGIEPAEE